MSPKSVTIRQEILIAAAQMMRRGGYTDMSLRDLAQTVGMKAGSLYYHFDSKEALATEVMRMGVEIVSRAVDEALTAQGDLCPRARLITAMRTHLQTLHRASDFSSAHVQCYPFMPPNVRDEVTALRRNYDRVWSDLIADYLGPQANETQVRHHLHMILGAMNWSLQWFNAARDDLDAYVDSLAALLPAPGALGAQTGLMENA